MSNVNVKRLVENIRSGTNVYTPLVELIVNAIQAIDAKGIQNGLVVIEVLRSRQPDLIDHVGDVDGFVVKDNGIGFTKVNRDAFDTLYTEQKIADGGKGFGRFTCLKYFGRVKVSSTFAEGHALYDRSFRMGLDKDIIIDEAEGPSQAQSTGATVEISGLKSIKFPDKKLDTISRVLVERLLPYFVDKERRCPRVVIREVKDSSDSVALNNYLGQENSQIVEMNLEHAVFSLLSNDGEKSFQVRVFKCFAPRTSKSKVSLVAHRREVTDNPLQTYIPEFAEEFFEPGPDQDVTKGRNFVIKAYVFGEYLNDNVSLERGEFRFQVEADVLNGISQVDIEQKAAEIAQSVLSTEIATRKTRKQSRIDEYVTDDAPWHRILAKEVDFSALPMRPSNQDIELYLQKKKYESEITTRTRVKAVLNSTNPDELGEKIAQLIESISDNSKNDLIHYVSMRKCALDLFSKSLEIGADGKHKSEGKVHDVIMPRKKDSEQLNYDAHNLGFSMNG